MSKCNRDPSCSGQKQNSCPALASRVTEQSWEEGFGSLHAHPLVKAQSCRRVLLVPSGSVAQWPVWGPCVPVTSADQGIARSRWPQESTHI